MGDDTCGSARAAKWSRSAGPVERTQANRLSLRETLYSAGAVPKLRCNAARRPKQPNFVSDVCRKSLDGARAEDNSPGRSHSATFEGRAEALRGELRPLCGALAVLSWVPR